MFFAVVRAPQKFAGLPHLVRRYSVGTSSIYGNHDAWLQAPPASRKRSWVSRQLSRFCFWWDMLARLRCRRVHVWARHLSPGDIKHMVQPVLLFPKFRLHFLQDFVGLSPLSRNHCFCRCCRVCPGVRPCCTSVLREHSCSVCVGSKAAGAMVSHERFWLSIRVAHSPCSRSR